MLRLINKLIKETEGKVENLTHVEEEVNEVNDPLYQIRENQFRIISALNAIEDVVLTHKTATYSGQKDTETGIESLRFFIVM